MLILYCNWFIPYFNAVIKNYILIIFTVILCKHKFKNMFDLYIIVRLLELNNSFTINNNY